MSSSAERRVQGYLDPKYFAMFDGLCIREDMGESEALRMIVKFYFNSIAQDKQREYIRYSPSTDVKKVNDGKVIWPEV